MLTPTIRQLEVFKAVVDSGTFNAAAAALDISQPSVSTHIRALESHVGQPLFDRERGRSPALTEIGRRIYDYADEVLNRSGRALADVQTLRADWDRTLTFAAQRYVADHLLPKVLSDFAQRHADVEIIADITVLDHVADKVRRRGADLGLFLARSDVPGIQSEVIGRQNMIFVAAPDHPLRDRKSIPQSDLVAFPFVGPVRNSEYGRLVYGAFAEIGLTGFTTITQSHDSRLLKEMVYSGQAVYCALPRTVRGDVDAGRLITLDCDQPQIALDVRVGALPGRKISSASLRFMAYLHELKQSAAFDH